MARTTELIFRGNNRSAIRALDEIAYKSDRMGRQVSRDTRQSSRGFKEMESSAHRLRGAMAGLAGSIGLAGVAFGIGAVVKAGESWQVQQSNLQKAFSGTGASVKALQAAASQLATHGGFGTTENVQALAILGTATHSQTRSVRDMTLATDIARRTGRSYTMIVKALALAEQGRTTGLSRLGIAIPKVTTAEDALKQSRFNHAEALKRMAAAGIKLTAADKARMALTNQITPAMMAQAKAQDAAASSQQVFAALQGRFGGQTATYSRTTQGRVTNLQNRFKELEERLGSGLLPIVNKVLTALDGMVGWLDKNRFALYGILGGLTALTAAMAFNKVWTTIATTKAILLGNANTFAAKGATQLGVSATAAAAKLDAAAAGGEANALTGGGGAARAAERDGKKLSKIGRIFDAGAKAAKYAPIVGLGAMGLDYAIKHGVFDNPKPTPAQARARARLGPHLAAGGPVGMDTVPAWLSPGEYVLNRRASAMLGAQRLASLNAGRTSGPQEIVIRVPIKLDGRTLAEGVTRYSLNRAARGPTSFVGGSIVTGAPGLPA